MSNLHRTLLDQAVQAFAPCVTQLAGASVYVNGASGFLASNLLLFLSEANRYHALKLRLFASARRPMDQVSVFRFTGIVPEVNWQIASAQEAQLPQEDGLIAVHTASYGSPKDYLREPMETMDANIKGMARLFDGPVLPAHVVYLSSAEIYGQPPEQAIPTPETFIGGSDLSSPRCIYAESKRVTEAMGIVLTSKFGIPLTVIRPFHIYGPGQRLEDGRIPIEFLRQARVSGGIHLNGDGTPTRCLCYAWDGIRQLASALPRGPEPLRAFNIGNPALECSVLKAAQACANTVLRGSSQVTCGSPRGNGGAQRCIPSIDRILSVGGQAPCISLEEGLRATAEWCDHSLGITRPTGGR